jgi:hypothetical protein
MADEEDSVEVAEEEAHNQWSMAKEYSVVNSPLLLHPARDLWQAMLLSSSRANPSSLEPDPTNLEINPALAECRNHKPQTLPREHTKILQTDNTSAPSAQTKSCPIRESGAAKPVGQFSISRA